MTPANDATRLPSGIAQITVTREPRHSNDTGWVEASSAPAPIVDGLTVSFRLEGGRFTADWQPKRPRITNRIWDAYKVARNAFFDGLHAETGLRIRVIDL